MLSKPRSWSSWLIPLGMSAYDSLAGLWLPAIAACVLAVLLA
jgi:hypothetical protein